MELMVKLPRSLEVSLPTVVEPLVVVVVTSASVGVGEERSGK